MATYNFSYVLKYGEFRIVVFHNNIDKNPLEIEMLAEN